MSSWHKLGYFKYAVPSQRFGIIGTNVEVSGKVEWHVLRAIGEAEELKMHRIVNV